VGAGVPARLERRVRAEFGEAAGQVLAQLASLELPLAEKQSPERLAAAIVVCARGDRDRLAVAVRLAERDWRDVLVAAGLANGDWPDRLDELLGGAGPG
jgi:hypothetical protein